MPPLSKSVVVTGLVSLLAGGAVGVAGTYATTSGAHETLVIPPGDTVVPRFSFKAGTGLKLVLLHPATGPAVYGIASTDSSASAIYLRVYAWDSTARAGGLGRMVTADSLTVNPGADTTVADTVKHVAKVAVCFSPIESTTKYGIRGDRVLSSSQWQLVNSWGCAKPPAPPASQSAQLPATVRDVQAFADTTTNPKLKAAANDLVQLAVGVFPSSR